MKIKHGEVRPILEGMQEISGKDLPAVFAHWIGKSIPILSKEFQDLEKDRNALCMKYCNKDDDGKPKLKKDDAGKEVYDIESLDDFNKELSELMNEEIEIKFTPILIDRLSHVDISPIALMKLNKFIIEEIPAVEKAN
jgi:hypothetical protein